jgi:hypothetical protein
MFWIFPAKSSTFNEPSLFIARILTFDNSEKSIFNSSFAKLASSFVSYIHIKSGSEPSRYS